MGIFTNRKKITEEINSKEPEMITTKDGMKLPADVAKGIPTLQYIDVDEEIRNLRIARENRLKSQPKIIQQATRYSSPLKIEDRLHDENMPLNRKQETNETTWSKKEMRFAENNNTKVEMNKGFMSAGTKSTQELLKSKGMQSDTYTKRRRIAEQEAYLKYLHDEIEKGRLDNERNERYGMNPSNRAQRTQTAKYSAVAAPQFKSVEKYLEEEQRRESFEDRHPTIAKFLKKFTSKKERKSSEQLETGEDVRSERDAFMQDLRNRSKTSKHTEVSKYDTVAQRRVREQNYR